jgi:hypothetical protein
MAIEISRRKFLAGTAALAIVRVGSLTPVVPLTALMIINEAYRRISDVTYLEGLSEQVSQTIIYGNPDWAPMQFVGFDRFIETEHPGLGDSIIRQFEMVV